MVLRSGYLAVALKLQEAADDLSNGDVCARLRDALSDSCRGTGSWCYYVDHFGDAETGDVIYSKDGDTMRAPYEISGTGGAAAKCVIDFDKAEDVVPRTVYEVEADEEDHYAAMEESFKAEKLYVTLPLYERFISKAEREKASADDFAGKGKSFPILKPEDVMAAARSIGRAGSANTGPTGLKSRIIAIAKRKGWTKYLPKAWQSDSSASEAARTRRDTADTNSRSGGPGAGTREAGQGGDRGLSSGQQESASLKLIESSAAWLAEIPLREASGARTNYPIRIINPGTGSTAHYDAGMLQREAAKFKPGTLMFWNHPTALEEAARPEGNLDHLAAITTTQAEWKENGPKGPGIYAEAKVMADYAEKVQERAPHIGLSIRAGGTQDGTKTVGGKPVLKEFTYIESVDYVTKAGRGGLALAEAAREAGILEEVEDMTKEEITALVEGVTTRILEAHRPAANADPSVKMLLERAIRGDATVEANRILAPLGLRESAKQLVVDNVLRFGEIPLKDGALDTAKFGDLVTAEAKRVAAALGQYPGVRGMGAGGGLELVGQTAEQRLKEAEAQRKLEENDFAADVKVYESLGLSPEAAKKAAAGREEAA